MSIVAIFGFLLELSLFIALWCAVLYTIFIWTRALLRRVLSTENTSRFHISLLAFVCTTPVLFELLRLANEDRATRNATIARGTPLSCDYSWWPTWVESTTCDDYHRSMQMGGYWQLNVLRVFASLIMETTRLVAGLCGASVGLLIARMLDELPWLYRIPAIVFICISLIVSTFALFGYSFSCFYGLIKVYRMRRDDDDRQSSKSINDDVKYYQTKHESSRNRVVKKVDELYMK